MNRPTMPAFTHRALKGTDSMKTTKNTQLTIYVDEWLHIGWMNETFQDAAKPMNAGLPHKNWQMLSAFQVNNGRYRLIYECDPEIRVALECEIRGQQDILDHFNPRLEWGDRSEQGLLDWT